MSLFVSVFVITILLGIISIFYVVKRKKYGNMPIYISLGFFVIALIIVIPLGNQPLTGDYKREASAFTFDRFLSESVPVGTIVKVEGQVISLDGNEVEEGDVFTLKSEDGAFYIKNNNVDKMKVKDGEIITVYGGYAGKSDNNTPSINAQAIER